MVTLSTTNHVYHGWQIKEMFKDAHREGGEGEGGEEGGTSCTPSKDFEKFGHKTAIKHGKRDPPRFSHNPLKRIWKRLCIYGDVTHLYHVHSGVGHPEDDPGQVLGATRERPLHPGHLISLDRLVTLKTKKNTSFQNDVSLNRCRVSLIQAWKRKRLLRTTLVWIDNS